MPVDGNLGGEAAVGEDGLYDPRGEGCTVQGAVLLRDRDVRVDEWLFFDDVVGLVIIVGLLQLVCLLTKQGSPHRDLWSTEEMIKEDGGRGPMLDIVNEAMIHRIDEPRIVFLFCFYYCSPPDNNV